jgi:hypothetical protein
MRTPLDRRRIRRHKLPAWTQPQYPHCGASDARKSCQAEFQERKDKERKRKARFAAPIIVS